MKTWFCTILVQDDFITSVYPFGVAAATYDEAVGKATVVMERAWAQMPPHPFDRRWSVAVNDRGEEGFVVDPEEFGLPQRREREAR